MSSDVTSSGKGKNVPQKNILKLIKSKSLVSIIANKDKRIASFSEYYDDY